MKKRRRSRWYLSLLILVLGWAALPAQSRVDSPPPNILLLVAEDMSARVGAYGDSLALTPSLDWLASEGIRFTNVFATAGVCAVNRTALITGVMAVSQGAQHMRASDYRHGELPYTSIPAPEVKAFPELLRKDGYFTFTDFKADYQFSGVRAEKAPFTIWDESGGEFLSRSMGWRNRAYSTQSFMGMYNLYTTHESGLFPLSRDGILQIPIRLGHHGLSGFERNTSPAEVTLPPYYPDTPTVRADVARQYDNIALMDREVGEILDALKADGLLEKTIVIWTTDHGTALPRGKREVYDSGIKVPMIIRWPEVYRPKAMKRGAVNDRLISMVDLAPSILDMAGSPVPEYMQGHSFISPKAPREFVFATKDRMNSAIDKVRAVRDKRFKYIRNYMPEKPAAEYHSYRMNIPMMQELRALHNQNQLSGEQRRWLEAREHEELYDTVSDTHEMNNLASRPEYRQVLSKMREVLDLWLASANDDIDLSEAAMRDKFWPMGSQPITKPVVFTRKSDGSIDLSSSTEGASIGFRVNGGRWKIYVEPLELRIEDQVEAKAVRYGFKESQLSTFH